MKLKFLFIINILILLLTNFVLAREIIPKLKPEKFIDKAAYKSNSKMSVLFKKISPENKKKDIVEKTEDQKKTKVTPTKTSSNTDKKISVKNIIIKETKPDKNTQAKKDTRQDEDLKPKLKPWDFKKPSKVQVPQIESKILNTKDFEIAKTAFDYVDRKKWNNALYESQKMDDKEVRILINWLYLIEPVNTASFSDYQSFINTNKDWPRINRLKFLAEQKINFDDTGKKQIIEYFNSNPPLSGYGKLRYAEALLDNGQTEKAKTLIKDGFKDAELTKNNLKYFIKIFKKYLTQDDYLNRVDYYSYEAKPKEVNDLIEYLPSDYQKLYRARFALFTKHPADKLISEIPTNLKEDPGLIYDRIKWRRKKSKFADALTLINESASNSLMRNQYLAKERLSVARDKIQDKDYQGAFDILKDHRLTEGSDYAEIEWHLGWLSLSFLNQPDKSIEHFTKMYNAVSYPVSKSRGAYWTGRAYKKLGQTSQANDWFRTASRYGTTFYGQLASYELGEKRFSTKNDYSLSDNSYEDFKKNNPLAKSVLLLKELNRTKYTKDILKFLGDLERNRSDREISMAGKLAQEIGRLDYAIQIGKNASYKNIILLNIGYPTIDTPKNVRSKEILETSIILSIIRQESEFDTSANSRVGARGLMQIMPATARLISKAVHLDFSRDKLKNQEYNVDLGSYHISGLVSDFNSYYLAFAAYNAGGAKVDKWLKANGDPRKKQIDPIDFIELIPFSETRNYVQRVCENISVYEYLNDPSNSNNMIGKLIYDNYK